MAMNLVNIDIYTILEATQELHFGNVKDLNVNRVELATVPKPNGEIAVKPYMSPTKVRGVARRALLWELNRLGDDKVKNCGIPATCGECDVCKLYGALVTTQKGKKRGGRTPETPQTEEAELGEGSIASRVIQAGGIGIKEIPPEIKQRLSSPCYIINGKIGEYNLEEIKTMLTSRGVPAGSLDRLAKPMPYEKEYVTGFFPVYWHCYMINIQREASSKMSEPQMIAYSFLETWKRIGAGHPKGAEVYQTEWISGEQDLLIVDIYTKPLGRRPVISPSEDNIDKAMQSFKQAAIEVEVGSQKVTNLTHITTPDKDNALFERFLGKDARLFLQQLSAGIATKSVLLKNGEV